MGSVKSVYGHTEGAAGLTGLLLAHAHLVTSCQPSVMHLRNVNPYVQAALQDWRKSHSAEAVIARQRSPAMEADAAGSSSFGMSGINAHLILEPGSIISTNHSRNTAAWRRTRCWPKPKAYALLESGRAGNGEATFVCNMQAARLAYLAEHQVTQCIVSYLPILCMVVIFKNCLSKSMYAVLQRARMFLSPEGLLFSTDDRYVLRVRIGKCEL